MSCKGVGRGGAWAGCQGSVPSPAFIAGTRLRAEGGPVGQAAEEAEAEEEGQADHRQEKLVLEVKLCEGKGEVAGCCHRHLVALLILLLGLLPFLKTEATVSIHAEFVPSIGDLASQQGKTQPTLPGP